MTEFVIDAAKGFQTADDILNKLKGIDTSLNSLGKTANFGDKLGVQFDALGTKIDKRNNGIITFGKSVDTLSGKLNQPLGNDNLFRNVDRGIDLTSKKLQTFNNQLEKTKQNASSGFGNKVGEGAASSLGIPLGAAALGGAATTAAIDFGKESIQAAREAGNAQLQLQAVSRETGISFQTLSKQAKSFGEQTALSSRVAESTFAQIANFANAAGRGDKLEEFRKRFADLAAAKGINASQLGDISRQLNALTDEATDKLLNANPSAFYDKFAASINKTANTLTDAEKRAAVFDEVLKKGAIFDGSAAEKLGGVNGQIEQLSANWANLQEVFGKSASPVITVLVNAVTTAVTGQTPKGGKPSDNTLFGQFFADSDNEFNDKYVQDYKNKQKAFIENFNKNKQVTSEGAANPNANIQNFAYNNFLKDKAGFSKLNTFDQTKELEKATTSAKAFIAQYQKNIENAITTKNLAYLKDFRADLPSKIALFDDKTTFNKLTGNVAKAINEGASEGFKRAAQKPDISANELRQLLGNVRNSKDLAPAAKTDLTNSLTKQLESTEREVKEKVKSLKAEVDSVFSNLYQKTGANNPIYTAFNEGNQALEKLKENIKGLPAELQKAAIALQQNLNANALFSTNLDNKLAGLDLRDQAESFRHPEKSIEDKQKEYANTIAAASKRELNPYYNIEDTKQGLYRNISANPFSISGKIIENATKENRDLSFQEQQGIYERQLIGGAFGIQASDKPPTLLNRGYNLDASAPGFVFNSALDVNARGLNNGSPAINPNQVQFATDSNLTLNQQSLITSLAHDRVNRPVDENLTIQQKLQKRLDVINNDNPLNAEQKDINDRKILSLAQGVDPNKLNDSERNTIADAFDRRAEKTEKYQSDANALLQKQLDTQIETNALQREWLEIAKKHGIKSVLEIIDKTNGSVNVRQGKSPTRKDAENLYGERN